MKRSKKSVLFAIPSFQDPYLPGDISTVGPLVDLIKRIDVDSVVLIGINAWKINTFLTEQYISRNFPNIAIDKKLLPIKSLESYKDIFYSLKNALNEYKDIFENQKIKTSFLLPQASFEKLFDCWLLLITSLNREPDIYQIEPHYALKANKSEKFLNDAINWSFPGDHEAKEPCPVFSKSSKVIPNKDISKSLLEAAESNRNLLIPNALVNNIELGLLLHNLSKKKSKPYLSIDCREIPHDICENLLFGFSHEINKKQIKKEGLINKAKEGTVHLVSFNHFSQALQVKISKSIIENKINKSTRVLISLTNQKEAEENSLINDLKQQGLIEELNYV